DNMDTVDHPYLAQPDPDMLRYLLGHVVEHREEAKEKGRLAQAFIRARFTWDHSVAAAELRLTEVCKRPIQRNSLRYEPAGELTPTQRRGPGRPRVSLAMIVRNEEHNLPACLKSVADLVDEIIIIDTGS